MTAEREEPNEEEGFGAILRGAMVIFDKDLRTEARTKEILLTMGFFGLLVVLIFSMSFYRGDVPLQVIVPGILWVAIAFAGTLGLSRAFDRERENDCIRALMLSPVPRASIYLGKLFGILTFMLVVELVVAPAVAFFFSLPLDVDRVLRIAAVLLLGTIGYAIVGTALAAALMRAHSRDVLLAIVIYPFVVPVMIAGVKATAAMLESRPLVDDYKLWLAFLVFFDSVFLVLSLWTFESLLLD
ncbi:MAG: heme exporter protein CcmB [Deltaproteobacteria bacterium]|nr:heme exporter protein CcmB [Deltaproteobacteria bacterium]